VNDSKPEENAKRLPEASLYILVIDSLEDPRILIVPNPIRKME
jgi:hypothetical protein